jgi:hypothetical protein
MTGMLISHVDDFAFNGTKGFVEETVEILKKELKISKVEKGRFRFCGMDLEEKEDRLELSMEDYANSIEKVVIDKKQRNEDLLNEKQMTVLRGMAGMLNWISLQCRPDLAFGAHQLAKCGQQARVKDLKFANVMVDKVKERESKIVYKNLGKPEDLEIYGFSDASYTAGEKATSGIIILIGNRKTKVVAPIIWKTKLIQKVCRAPKDAETLSLGVAADLSLDIARKMEEVMYNVKKGRRFKVKMYCDNAGVLESIASSKQVERRTMRSEVMILKQFLEDGEIDSVIWVPDELMIADVMTKWKNKKMGISEVMSGRRLNVLNENVNVIKHNGSDFVIEGKALRDDIIKRTVQNPIKKTKARVIMEEEKKRLEDECVNETKMIEEKNAEGCTCVSGEENVNVKTEMKGKKWKWLQKIVKNLRMKL